MNKRLARHRNARRNIAPAGQGAQKRKPVHRGALHSRRHKRALRPC